MGTFETIIIIIIASVIAIAFNDIHSPKMKKSAEKKDRKHEKNIGDVVNIKATIVDFNDGCQKAKVRIEGFAEDKNTTTERYIWVNYNDMKNDDIDFLESH